MADDLDLDALAAAAEKVRADKSPFSFSSVALRPATLDALIARARAAERPSGRKWHELVLRLAQAERERDDLRAAVARVEELAIAWECVGPETGAHRQLCPSCSRADTLRSLLVDDAEAVEPEADGCAHEWLLRPESDTWVCLICGAES